MTQREALEILKTGRNVFLTGAAGSGKTHTLRDYIKYLRELNAEVAVTASTGIAATHMGGVTIHSWSGLGIKDSLRPHELDEIVDKPHIRSRVKGASVLIIDEISMLDDTRLNLLDMVLKRVRGSTEPFGGLQVIFCGDFFQLPPVQRRPSEAEEISMELFEGTRKNKSKFAFHSPVWRDLNLKVCYLEEQHRQDDDKYLQVLNSIRDNSVTEEIIEILNERLDAKIGQFVPTRLYSHNIDVDKENEEELKKLSGELYKYEMESRGAKNLVEALKKSCLAPEVLKLKKGAKVMFVKNNFEEGFVNGTLGVVERLDKDSIHVRTLKGDLIDVPLESWRIEEDSSVKAEIAQFPLRLAWAITVHKSQGMSLDSALIDLSDSFEKGMGYVALSRVRTLSGLSLRGFNDMALRISEEVLEFDKNLKGLSQSNRSHLKKLGDKIGEMQEEFKNKISREEFDKVKGKKQKGDSLETTKGLFESGLSVKEIAKVRNLTESTIFGHIVKIKEEDPKFNISSLRDSIPKAKFQKIYGAFQKVGTTDGGKRPLAPVIDILGPRFTFDELRLVRLFL